MNAIIAYTVGMKSNQVRQYTIRNLGPDLDRKLRQKAKEKRESLNEIVLEALRRGVGLTDSTPLFHDLDSLAGSWQDDPEFDNALEMQDQIDPNLWS